MRRSVAEISFLCTLLAAASAFAQQGLPAGQQGLPAGQPGPQSPPPPSRVARQGSSFDRVSTLRREVAASQARVGQGGLSRLPSSSPGQPQSPSHPLSFQTRTTPHTFYPGMRGSQGPNMNVPQYRSRFPRGPGFMTPGMFMNRGAGRSGLARPPVRLPR